MSSVIAKMPVHAADEGLAVGQLGGAHQVRGGEQRPERREAVGDRIAERPGDVPVGPEAVGVLDLVEGALALLGRDHLDRPREDVGVEARDRGHEGVRVRQLEPLGAEPDRGPDRSTATAVPP